MGPGPKASHDLICLTLDQARDGVVMPGTGRGAGPRVADHRGTGSPANIGGSAVAQRKRPGSGQGQWGDDRGGSSASSTYGSARPWRGCRRTLRPERPFKAGCLPSSRFQSIQTYNNYIDLRRLQLTIICDLPTIYAFVLA
jgi:hypothetical protein